MGYFSNGTENLDYEYHYCSQCVHADNDNPEGPGCPIMLAHLLHNYEECNNKDSILHILIPRTKDGLSNEKCSMFILDKNADAPGQQKMF